MDYLSALQIIHDVLHPNNYLEIGCRSGLSLGLSKCHSLQSLKSPIYEFSLG